MAEWKARVLDAYYGLGERDRRVVNWGAPIILLLVIYLLVGRPLLNGYLQAATTHESLRSELVWLAAQQQHLHRINSFCPTSIDPVAEADVEFIVTGQARRLGLEPRYDRQGQRLAFELQNAAGNSVLTLVRELACRGMVVSLLEMNASSSSAGLVDAKLELRLL